jgi:hypothetical protein
MLQEGKEVGEGGERGIREDGRIQNFAFILGNVNLKSYVFRTKLLVTSGFLYVTCI